MTKTPRKLVFVNRFYAPDISATAQILTDIAEGLAARDWPVCVLTSRLLYDGADKQLARRDLRNGVEISRIWTSRFGRGNILGRAFDYMSFYLSAMVHVLLTAKRNDIYVVKTDPPLLMVIIGLALRIKGARRINWLQDIYPEIAAKSGVAFAKGGLGWCLTYLRNRSIRKADHTVVISEGMRRFIADQMPGMGSVTIIDNFTDDAAIRPVSPSQNTLRREWGFAPNDFIVGYSGNLGRAHDLETMLSTAEQLRDIRSIKFLFIGGGHLRETLVQQAELRNLASIITKPYQPRDVLFYSLAVPDIHWLSLSPDFEGLIMPSKLYGIAAAGKPMIFVGDPQGDIGRLCRDYEMGLPVEPGDGYGFASAIRRLHGNQAYRERMGLNARAFIDERANRDLIVTKWENMLRTIVA